MAKGLLAILGAKSESESPWQVKTKLASILLKVMEIPAGHHQCGKAKN